MMSPDSQGCNYCLRQADSPKIQIRSWKRRPEGKKWGLWVTAALLVISLVWLIHSFLRFVDDLLQGRW